MQTILEIPSRQAVTPKNLRNVLHVVYRANNSYDPTHTTVLRNAYVKEMNRRFKNLTRLIKLAVVDRDCFGLQTPPIVQVNTSTIHNYLPNYKAFAFERTIDKQDGFMQWFRRQTDRELLSGGRGALVSTVQMPQLGTAIDASWQNTYIDDSYRRGVMRSRYEMGRAGLPVPQMDETGGISASMSTPMHLDRVGVMYTRAFTQLKNITDEMDYVISTVLAKGLVEGTDVKRLARQLVSSVNGEFYGDLEITDTLGRRIPAQRRAMMLARTEVIRAHHQGMVQEYRNWELANVKVKAEWKTAEDGRVCERCLQLEGVEFTLDEVADLIPLHPQCRCIALPVVDKTPPTTTPTETPVDDVGQEFTEDGVDFTNVSEDEFNKIEQELLEETRQGALEEFGMTPFEQGELTPDMVNQGYCDIWANKFQKRFGGQIRTTSLSDGTAADGHYWVKLGDKLFDAEVFKKGGVKSFNQLPFGQRAAIRYNRTTITPEFLNESTIGANRVQKMNIPTIKKPRVDDWDDVARNLTNPNDAREYMEYKREYDEWFDAIPKDSVWRKFNKTNGYDFERLFGRNPAVDKLRRTLQNKADDHILEILSKWQGSTHSEMPMAMKYVASKVEKRVVGKLIYPDYLTSADILKRVELAEKYFDVNRQAYLRARAFNQSYMQAQKIKKEILYRGTDGKTGKAWNARLQVEGTTRTRISLEDANLTGYTKNVDVAADFGVNKNGVTVKRIVPADEIVIHQDLMCKLTGRFEYEMEYIVLGGPRQFHITKMWYQQGARPQNFKKWVSQN